MIHRTSTQRLSFGGGVVILSRTPSPSPNPLSLLSTPDGMSVNCTVPLPSPGLAETSPLFTSPPLPASPLISSPLPPTGCRIDNCESCFSKDFCTKCKAGFYLHKGRCSEKCPEGFAPLEDTMECGGKTGNSKDICVSEIAPYSLCGALLGSGSK